MYDFPLIIWQIHLENRQHTMAITNVESKASQIKVFDETNTCVSQMPAGRVELLGHNSDFFVTLEGAWIRTYDQDCKRIATMNGTHVTVRTVSSSTFTTEEDGWLKTYNAHCKKISERAQ